VRKIRREGENTQPCLAISTKENNNEDTHRLSLKENKK
jgi:hypothetical protein